MSNCPRCGKVFVKFRERICPDCIALEKKQFETLKDYLDEHPFNSIVQLSEETEVPEKVILGFIREGRIIASDNVTGLNCERCGAPVLTGRLCQRCSEQVSSQVMNTVVEAQRNAAAAQADSKSRGVVMHTFKKNKDNT